MAVSLRIAVWRLDHPAPGEMQVKDYKPAAGCARVFDYGYLALYTGRLK
jgi:hypothetical protein